MPRKRPRIAFFAPNSQGNTYWPQVYKILAATGRSLNFEFVPYDMGVGNRFARKREVIKALSSDPRPDAAIVSVVVGLSKPILDAAEELHIPVMILGPVFPAELTALGGGPRRTYRRWVGYVVQDEVEKGYQLGMALLNAAEQAGAFTTGGKLQVIGLGGDATWFGSRQREEGLVKAIKQHPRATLQQVVPTLWTPGEGQELTAKMLRRFPEATVVWAASDQLGLGAAAALAANHRDFGVTAFTGGLDLSDAGLAAIKDGKFVATVASSLLSYAEVAIYLYDYLQGIDFVSEVGSEITLKTYTANKANLDRCLRLANSMTNIDFAKFSKAHNQRLARYDFSLEAYGAAVKP